MATEELTIQHRRMAAARALRGLSQEALDALGAKEGLDKQALSRAERGEIPLTKAHLRVAAAVMGLPLDWMEGAGGDVPEEGEPTLAAVAATLGRIEARIGELAAQVEHSSERLRPLGSTGGGRGGAPVRLEGSEDQRGDRPADQDDLGDQTGS